MERHFLKLHPGLIQLDKYCTTAFTTYWGRGSAESYLQMKDSNSSEITLGAILLEITQSVHP